MSRTGVEEFRTWINSLHLSDSSESLVSSDSSDSEDSSLVHYTSDKLDASSELSVIDLTATDK